MGDLFENDSKCGDSSDSDLEDESSNILLGMGGSQVANKSKNGKNAQKLTSGLFRGSGCKVRKSVAWPMDKLGPQHSNYGKQIYHKDLDMRLLVLGELAIIKDVTSGETESKARTELLMDLIFNSENFQWNAILRLHAAVLREIEMGNMEWGDSYAHMSQLILTPLPKVRSNHLKGDRPNLVPKLWY